MQGSFGIGEAVDHSEDERLTSGGGRFLDDLHFAGATYGYVLRSPHAHALIRSIDLAAARSAPGVLLVWSAAEWEGLNLGAPRASLKRSRPDGKPMFAPQRPVLVGDRVRYVGDPIAFVVAETLNMARDAAELIDIDYEPLAGVTDAVAATADGAACVWDECPDNISNVVRHGDATATAAALSKAATVITRRYRITRVYAQYLETRGAVGQYDSVTGRYVLHADVQYPHRVRAMLAETVLGVPEHQVRVVTGDVGGAFGAKGWQYVEHRLVLLAARALDRPVKWTCDRSEAIMADEHGRDAVADVSLALDAGGRFLALDIRMRANIGAYVGSDRNLLAPFNNMALACGVYAFESAHVEVVGVLTNTNPTAPYRGAGRPEAAYCIERIVEDAARELAVDPIELRRRNMLRSEQLPHRTPLGLRYDCGDFPGNLDAALDLAEVRNLPSRRAASRAAGRLRGFGVANTVEQAGGVNAPEFAEIRIDARGDATILAGTKAQGQGHETMYKQIVFEVLGLAPERISFIDGDTDIVAFGMGTNSSRSVIVGGSAMLIACEKLRDKARAIAAHMLKTESASLVEQAGGFKAPDGRTVDLAAIAAAAHRPRDLPPGVEPGLIANAMFVPSADTFPTSCHVCEVEIDPKTGAVVVDRYAVVDDVGTVINPVGVKTQIQGGVAQGLGQVLMEQVVWDPETGQLLTANFLNYGIPRAASTCDIRIESRPTITRTNPLGAKGAGESGTVGALPAIMNAIMDALASRGVSEFDMPASPERVWTALGSPSSFRREPALEGSHEPQR